MSRGAPSIGWSLRPRGASRPKRTTRRASVFTRAPRPAGLTTIGAGTMASTAGSSRLTTMTVRASGRAPKMRAFAAAGATIAVTDQDTLIISGLAAEKIVALLGESGLPFSEVSPHRATLEEAYMELTKDAVEFRAAAAAGEAAR